MNKDHLEKGQEAETRAAQFLQNQGLQLIERNFRCKLGEIDLIMKDQSTLVFVEVRLRSNRFFTQAAESVNWHKQRKLIKAAQFYLQQHKVVDSVPCRFDVIAIENNLINPSNWIKNAFGA
jgi:putative endonuclease